LKPNIELRLPADRPFLKNALRILRIDASFSTAFLEVIVVFHDAIFETPLQPFRCVRFTEVFTGHM
jgi:hypothetical protein